MRIFRSKTTEHPSLKYDADIKISRPSHTLFQSTASSIREDHIKPFALAREMWTLNRGPGELFPTEYFLFDLSNKKYDGVEKRRFASASLHPRFLKVTCNPKWDALTEDKWACYAFLSSQRLPHPQTLAVIDKTIRSFGIHRKLTSVAELDLFLSDAMFPIFAKANTGLGSFGAFIINGYEAGCVHLSNSQSISVEVLMNDIGARTFLLQAVVRNHIDIASFAVNLATVRTVNLVDTDQVITPFTILKIPTGVNVADNYWRSGNLIADVDRKTGKIRRVVRDKGKKLTELTQHPDNGVALVGFQIPFWHELLSMNDACARLYADVRYNTLDIAITDAGPVIIEVNTGGAFDLPQFASGEGFLTEEVMQFFERAGFKFRGRKRLP